MLETSLFIAWAIFGSFAEAAGLDPIANLCSRWYHQSQVKNDVLFIDGGIASFSQRQQYANPEAHDDRLNYTGPITVGTNNYIIVVDMSTSWDWKTNISETAINKTVASGTSNYVPRVQSGALYYGTSTDDQVYLYGGVTPDINTSFTDWQAPTTNQYTLWGFNTKTYGWTQYDVSLGVPERPSWGAFAEVPEHGLAFYLNGLVTNMSSAADYTSDTPTTALEGMVVLDLQNHTATNISGDSIIDGNPRVRGGMVYIPQIGNMGVLVSTGGGSWIDGSLQLANMSQINIFDVESVTGSNSTGSDGWYTQMITAGKLPEPRVDFCLVVVPAPDNSSFNIHMYGGWDPIQDKAYDDIWVLSIPSFEWIQVYSGVLPRFAHTCHFVGNRQMVTVGGTNSTDVTAARCDWEWMGVAILDLTTMAWGSVFDSEKPQYQVNSIISAVIGGGLDGGATKLVPDGGWTSASVASLFTGSTDLTTPYTPAGKGSSSDGFGINPNSGRKINVGAIAGGVIGGVTGVVLIIVLLVWWYRRRANRGGTVHRGPAELDSVQSQIPAEIHGRPVFTELYGSQVPQEPVEMEADEPRHPK